MESDQNQSSDYSPLPLRRSLSLRPSLSLPLPPPSPLDHPNRHINNNFNNNNITNNADSLVSDININNNSNNNINNNGGGKGEGERNLLRSSQHDYDNQSVTELKRKVEHMQSQIALNYLHFPSSCSLSLSFPSLLPPFHFIF